MVMVDISEKALSFPLASVALHLVQCYFKESGGCTCSKGSACMALGFYKP